MGVELGCALAGEGDSFLNDLFSCSLRDMAMANCSSSSSSVCCWVPVPVGVVEGV